jgi:hypothetical protein
MSRKVCTAAVAALTGAFLISAGGASGGETARGGFSLEVFTKRPGAPTGLGFHVVYKNPADPQAKPPPVTGAIFRLPAGMRIHNAAVPRCMASDDELMASGRAACPAASRIGAGTLTAMTGFPGADPVSADLVAFNAPRQVIEVVFIKGTNVVAGMDRLTIGRGRLVAHPPATPGGPPDGRTAVREIRLRFPRRIGASGRAFITTPPACKRGIWRARARYEFADGGSTVIGDRSPCRRGGERG